MKELKTKLIQMLKKVRKNLEDRLSDVFFIIFWAVIACTLSYIIFFTSYDVFGGSADSARYLLSALAQSQAAIIAIIVTLTLVAVQLASQTYSPRVMDLFLKRRAFWALLLIYGLSIMYDVIILSGIPPIPSNETLNENISILNYNINIFNVLMFIGLILMAGTFSALFPYIKAVIDGLKPKRILDKLSNDINTEKFERVVSDKYKKDPRVYSPRMLEEGEDKIIPLIDITKKAIRVDDLTTARNGIKKLEEICLNIVDKNKEKEGIVKHFSEHFIRISNVAFIQDDEDSVIEVIESLGNIGKKTIEKNIDGLKVENTLGKIGIKAVKKEWNDATNFTANTLRDMFISSVEKLPQRFTNDSVIKIEERLDPLRNIVLESMEKDMGFAVESTIKPFKEVFIHLIDLNPDLYNEVKGILSPFVKKTIKKMHNIEVKWLYYIIKDLLDIGIKFVDTNRGESRIQSYITDIVDNVRREEDVKGIIGIIHNYSIKNEIKNPDIVVKLLITCLRDIGIKTANKRLDIVTKKVINYIGYIGNYSERVTKLNVTQQVLESIESVGAESINNKLDGATIEIFKSIFLIGIETEDRVLKNKLHQRLEEISKRLEDKNLINNAIKEFESDFKSWLDSEEKNSRYQELRRHCEEIIKMSEK